MKTMTYLALISILIILHSCVSINEPESTRDNDLERIQDDFIPGLLDRKDPELVVQLGHRKGINNLAVSPDGRLLVTASKDETLKLWDVASGKEMRTFTGHKRMVNDAVFSPDGNYIASCCGGSSNEQLFLWDARTGKKIKTFYCDNVIDINCVDYSPDGKFLATGNGYIGTSKENFIGIWDVKTAKRIKKIEGHTKRITKIHYSDDGKYLLSASDDNTLGVWKVKNSRQVLQIDAYNRYTCDAGFLKNTPYIISVGANNNDDGKEINSIDIWDRSGKKIKSFVNNNTSHSNTGLFLKESNKLITFGQSGHYPELKIWDWESREVREVIRGKNAGLTTDIGHYNIFLLDSGFEVVTSMPLQNFISFWDLERKKKSRETTGSHIAMLGVDYSPDGGYAAAVGSDGFIRLWDLTSAKLKHIFGEHTSYGTVVRFSPDGRYIASGTRGAQLDLWDTETGKNIKKFHWFLTNVSYIAFSPDGEKIAAGGISYGSGSETTGEVLIFSVETGKTIKILRGFNSGNNDVCFSPDGKKLLIASFDKTVQEWDVETGLKLRELPGHSGPVRGISFLPDKKKFLTWSYQGWDFANIYLWDYEKGEIISQFKQYSHGYSSSWGRLSVSPDGKSFLLALSTKNELSVWDLESGKKTHELKGHLAGVQDVVYSPDGLHALSSSLDSTIRIWDLQTNHYVTFLSRNQENGWLIITHDNYWDALAGCGEWIAMVRDLECWNIDQFAITNNRPDIILQRLGSADQELKSHYYHQYLKRLKRLGIREQDMKQDYYVPIARILEIRREDKFITLKCSFSAPRYDLLKYNFFINDVPLFGAYGKDIIGSKQVLEERVELTTGENKIEISCINTKGAESYRAVKYEKYDKPVKGDLYFIGFGVSEYNDKNLNLKYAHQDVMDLSTMFAGMEGEYNAVHTRIYINEEVTPDSIEKAKSFIKDAKVDDTFILFISGHGVHDRDEYATYYFLTHNTNLNDLKNTAANFEFVENLMQGIAPRKKLFLMDTCESGEVEDGARETYYAMAESKDIRPRTTYKGILLLDKKQEKRIYLYDNDRYIYNDLLRRSGAIVFSSCKGGEFSYESDKVKNGFFTEEIINGISQRKADKDSDGVVTINELKDYVTGAVSKLSSGMQNPTVDRDNIYVDFEFKVSI
ncbi:MAG: WD40 repeat domain-containing protein [Spirochaetales bacterium]|nr:WD40 repeat domain-containing protein [Spirochaetales bacterium]